MAKVRPLIFNNKGEIPTYKATPLLVGNHSVNAEKFNTLMNVMLDGEELFPITETANIETNEHGGLPVIGGPIQQDSGFTYSLLLGKKAKDLFRKAGIKDALPLENTTLTFQNLFPSRSGQFIPVGVTGLGLAIMSQSVLMNKGGRYFMAIIYFAPDSIAELPNIIEFIVNQIFL